MCMIPVTVAEDKTSNVEDLSQTSGDFDKVIKKNKLFLKNDMKIYYLNFYFKLYIFSSILLKNDFNSFRTSQHQQHRHQAKLFVFL